MKKKIAITSDCVCDLSEEILEEYEVEVIHFNITIDRGCFKDLDEITSANIIEYFENGGKSIATEAPNPKEFEAFFERILRKYDEIIHIVIADGISKSYQYANEILGKFQGKVHIFDSGHVSAGIGFLVIKAAELVREEKDVEEIIDELNKMKKRVSTSFITHKTDYLYRAGKVSRGAEIVCNALKIHPVIYMRNGVMAIKTAKIGTYEKAAMRYLRSALGKSDNIDKRRVFIMHCGCSVKMISKIKSAVKEICGFDEVIVAKASATVSSNCGPNTFGVIFVREE